MERYDLTTKEGFEKATRFILMSNPAFALGKYIFDKIFEHVPSPKNQAKAAEEIITAAQKSGMKEIEIEMDQEAGIDLKGRIESEAGGGIPIEVSPKCKGKVIVRGKF